VFFFPEQDRNKSGSEASHLFVGLAYKTFSYAQHRCSDAAFIDRSMRDKKKYSNSYVVRKNISERNKKP
jgi:hypothetical protein